MKHLGKFAASGVLAASLIAASQAQATPTIEYSATGTAGSFTPLPTVTGGTGNTRAYLGGTLNGLTLSVTSVQSNAPGAPTLAETLSASVSISNTTAATQTLYLSFGDIGFTNPSAPPAQLLDSHIGGTVPANTADSISFTSFVNSSNGQNAFDGLAAPTGSPALPSAGSFSFSNDEQLVVNSLSTPYSMTELLEVTLGTGSQINFSASSTLTPIAVPEPVTLGLLGVGLVGLGMVRRRRNG